MNGGYRPCPVCGHAFPRHHHGNERYCSPRCRRAAAEARAAKREMTGGLRA